MNQIVIRNRYKVLFGVTGFLVAALPRFMAARGDMWLDEIWSLYLIKSAEHIWDLLSIYLDNNHILNSFYLFFTGENGSALSYRLLSVLSGSAVVVIMGLINLQRGLTAGLITLGLGMFSYPLIHYSSEARGYAPAMLFALISYVCLRQIINKGPKWSIMLLQASVVLGLLSHLTFIFVYVSLLAWMMANLMRSHSGLRQIAIKMTYLNWVSASVIFAFCYLFVKKMSIGGGNPRSLSDVLVSVATLISGAPETGLPHIIGIVLSCIGLVGGLLFLYREGGDEWFFVLFVVILIPLLFLTTINYELLNERFFLVGLPFFYLMVGRWAASILVKGSLKGKITCVLILMFFLVGNFQRNIDLMNVGRGGYRQALQFMAVKTSGRDIIVGSDHDFRNKIVLQYYSQDLPLGKRLLYFDKNNWPANGPEWIITHSQKAEFNPPLVLEIQGNGDYYLAANFKFRGLSGFHWALYHQQGHTIGH